VKLVYLSEIFNVGQIPWEFLFRNFGSVVRGTPRASADPMHFQTRLKARTHFGIWKDNRLTF